MGHSYLMAAFVATWAIQLGYLAFILLKWQGQRKKLKPGKPLQIDRRAVAGR